MSMKTKTGISFNLLAAIMLALLFFNVTHKVYQLPFSYGDDHRVLGMLHPEKASETYKAAMFGQSPGLRGSLVIDEHFGRFRPLSWSYYKLLTMLYGGYPFWYRITNIVVLFFSCFFLLGIFSFFKVDKLPAFLILAIYVFGRNNEAWWTLDPPSQNIGECLLLAGMYVWVQYRKEKEKGFYMLPAFLFFLAAMNKESYIFCIPIILLTDYFFISASPKFFAKEYWLSLFAAIMPFTGLVITLLRIQKVYAYAYPDSILGILGYNIFQFLLGAAFLFAPLALLLVNRKNMDKNLVLKLLFVLFLWGAVQLVLLKGIKLDSQHHYLIPWLIYPFIITAIALTKLREVSVKWYKIMAVFYTMVALFFARNTYSNSSSYTASLQGYYKMIDAIKKAPGPKIIYLTDDACTDDWTAGTRIILDNEGINTDMYFCTVADSVPSWEKEYAAHSTDNAYKHIPFNDDVFTPDGRWIILVDSPSKNGIINDNFSFYKEGNDSYVKIKGKAIKIPGSYYYFSEAYPGLSFGDILKGNFASVNYKGFYAIKLDDWHKGEVN